MGRTILGREPAINPADESVITETSEGDTGHVERALEAAWKIGSSEARYRGRWTTIPGIQ